MALPPDSLCDLGNLHLLDFPICASGRRTALCSEGHRGMRSPGTSIGPSSAQPGSMLLEESRIIYIYREFLNISSSAQTRYFVVVLCNPVGRISPFAPHGMSDAAIGQGLAFKCKIHPPSARHWFNWEPLARYPSLLRRSGHKRGACSSPPCCHMTAWCFGILITYDTVYLRLVYGCLY